MEGDEDVYRLMKDDHIALRVPGHRKEHPEVLLDLLAA